MVVTSGIVAQSTEERNEMKSRLASGEQRALFCSPEAATGGLLLQLFSLAERGLLGAVIVDEAHLIDQWGRSSVQNFSYWRH